MILLVYLLSYDGQISRPDGIIAIGVYLLFIWYMIADLQRTRAAQEEIEEAEE